MLFLLLTCVTIVLFYLAFVKPLSYWKKRGIKTPTPWPILGNMTESVLQRKSLAELIQHHYNINKGKRFYGFYQFMRPVLHLRDLELIKTVGIKEFDTFPEHPAFVSEEVDPLGGKILFSMRGGEKWRNMRATLSPAFTASKLKNMFKLMDDCGKQFTNYFLKQDGIITVEMRDAFSRYTNDVIASTAFGLSCDSLTDRTNEFYIMGKSATNFSGLRALRFFGFDICPSLMKAFNISLFDLEVRQFFTKIIKDTIKLRQTQNITRPDIIHLLLEAKKGKLKYEEDSQNGPKEFAAVEESSIGKTSTKTAIPMTDEDITAQAFVFFIAGFDTVSILMCHATYELALNPDVQDRLYKEIEETLNDCNNNLSYEALMGMKYLDMVISETLRKWPPNPFTNRLSAKNFEIPPETTEEKPFLVEKGTVVIFPIFALHRDPKYFPNPEKFDPERFSEENRDNIVPISYIPFGVGPRNCIASRFALLEAKILLTHLVSKFNIVPVEKTQIPLVLSKQDFSVVPKNGFWLGLEARCK